VISFLDIFEESYYLTALCVKAKKPIGMPTDSRQIIKVQGLQLIDAFLVWLGFAVAFEVRDPILHLFNRFLEALGHPLHIDQVGTLYSISLLLLVLVPLTPLALEAFGFYRSITIMTSWQALQRVLLGLMMMIGAASIFAVFFKALLPGRAVLVIAPVCIAVMLMLRFWLMRGYSRLRNKQEKVRESIVLAGNPQEIEKLWLHLQQSDSSRWKVVGRYDLSTGKWEEFQQLLHDEAVERVIFAASHSEFEHIAMAVEMCEVRGIEAWISAHFMQTSVARPSFDSIEGRPMLVLRSTPDFSWALLAKVWMDRLGALAFILMTSPIWLLAAIAIKWQSPGPVFYRQERAGRYGKAFGMWKFRTMVVDAEEKLEELKQLSCNQMSGPVFKLENDPRIFPVGRLLRKYSIDELPQLWNVLVGDMSLVGPRPMAMYELPNIERSEHRRKLSVKPGLTCIWQVSGRNQITAFEDWVALDLQYIDQWSLWLDIKLLLKTIPAVLFAKGAK
jgi:exopolysaccharide biosynthesis polyprenyl glycosylphosphotransferase